MMFLVILLIAPLVSSENIVNTNNGPIRGSSVVGKKVEAFLGIPYAEPPVGELRFAKPVPKSPWDKTYDANKMPPSCVQGSIGKLPFPMDVNVEMSEDCLFLNLWVPEGGNDLKPIMVFIHGGAFMFGSSNWTLYDGATLSERGDVIVATMNYRLATLGFFSGFIDEAAGNMGMYDQVMAIQWIKDNAKHFRGDPDNIVLMGESAGAFSVSLHLVSPLSKNLFKRGILQSGSTFHPMFSGDNKLPLMGSQAVASLSGCASDKEDLNKNPKEVVDCLKRLSPEKISEIDTTIYKTVGMLLPRVGDDFLPENPTDLFRKGNFKNSEVLIGINQNEGSVFIALQKSEAFGVFGEKVDVDTFDEASAKETFNRLTKIDDESGIFQSYLDRVKEMSRYTYLDALSDAYGDFFISCATVFQADFQSMKESPVYFYSFNYLPHSSPLAEWMGVAHFVEVQYIFGNPLYKNFTESEKEFSDDIMDMWVAFAKTGNPTIPGGIKWPRYTLDDPKYYSINQRDGVGVRPDNYRCDVWRKMFGSVVPPCDATS